MAMYSILGTITLAVNGWIIYKRGKTIDKLRMRISCEKEFRDPYFCCNTHCNCNGKNHAFMCKEWGKGYYREKADYPISASIKKILNYS